MDTIIFVTGSPKAVYLLYRINGRKGDSADGPRKKAEKKGYIA